jgi:regulator of sigma E protease
MIDESMDTAQLAREPQEWEYRSRPAWQRMFIISGGVLMNVILAIVIYSAILYTWGTQSLPLQNAKYGLQFSPELIACGFRHGDNIISVDGEKVKSEGMFIEKILIDGGRHIVVDRHGESVSVLLPEDMSRKMLASDNLNSQTAVRIPFVVANVAEGSPAAESSLQSGDSIVGINGKDLFIFQDISAELKTLKNKTVDLTFYRNGQRQDTEIRMDSTGTIGVELYANYSHFFELEKTTYNLFSSIPAGISMGWKTLTSYVKQFKIIFSKEGAKQLSGIGGIGKMFAPVWDWQSFWVMTALLSIVLAFMNFLPIPGLDGGHFIFLIFETLTGRKPSDKFMGYATTVGFILLMLLVIYANGNDLYKFIANKW